jgi:hypothetical protein
MSHALKKLIGQFDCVQRSLIFIYVKLGARAEQLLHRPSAPHTRQGINLTYSSRKVIFLIFPLLAMTPSVPLRSEEIGDYPATSPLLLQKEADD